MTSLGVQSACPQCGAPLHFGAGHSLVNVCEHCRSTVARMGVDVRSLGRMPDLVTTDTRLALGLTGKLARLDFRIVGRVQMSQGRAQWDEWYVLWSDGSFGWLAEAQGRLIVSHRFEHALHVPAFADLQAGTSLPLEGLGTLSIEEVGEARVLSAEGELPFQPHLERRYRFVDASLPGNAYVTLDYGFVGDDAEAFVGRQLTYAEAGIVPLPAAAPRGFAAPKAQAEALACPSCAAPLSLRAVTSESIVCDSCHALCRLSEGKFALVQAIKHLAEPALPLGARGTLFGQPLEVIGWLQREVSVAGQNYVWSEYLLHGEHGYRWLSEAHGHFTYLAPIPAADVQLDQTVARYRSQKYQHFQASVDVRYGSIRGEFYWQIDPEDRASLDDYVAPPQLLSLEASGREAQWTHGQYVDPKTVWASFAQTGDPPTKQGVSPCQPNPHTPTLTLWLRALLALSVLAVLSMLIISHLPASTLLVETIPLSNPPGVTLSQSFSITTDQAVEIEAYADMVGPQNSWVGLDIALINDDTGESDALGLELSHYEGYDEGRWVEHNALVNERIGPVAAGKYVLRVEPQFEPTAQLPRSVRLQVKQGVFLWFPLICAGLLFLLPTLIAQFLYSNFETRRWADSDHPKYESD